MALRQASRSPFWLRRLPLPGRVREDLLFVAPFFGSAVRSER